MKNSSSSPRGRRASTRISRSRSTSRRCACSWTTWQGSSGSATTAPPRRDRPLRLLLLRSKNLVLPQLETRAIKANRQRGELDLVLDATARDWLPADIARGGEHAGSGVDSWNLARVNQKSDARPEVLRTVAVDDGPAVAAARDARDAMPAIRQKQSAGFDLK